MADGTGERTGHRARRLPLVQASYTDETGRQWAVMVPLGQEGAPEMGIPIGPPDVVSLGLPEEIGVRLHNELFRRGLWNRDRLRGRGPELMAALQAAFRVDAARLSGLFR